MFADAMTEFADDHEAEHRFKILAPVIDGALIKIRSQAERGDTGRCEAAVDSLKEAIRNARLPQDYADHTSETIDALMLNAFMKATAIASREAISAGMEDEVERRSAKIREARQQLAGAMRYKAPDEFRRKCEMMIETALFSGGIRSKGPTRAKPDHAQADLQEAV